MHSFIYATHPRSLDGPPDLLFRLASEGVYLAPVSRLPGGGLLPHLFTLTSNEAVIFCGTSRHLKFGVILRRAVRVADVWFIGKHSARGLVGIACLHSPKKKRRLAFVF